MVREIGRRETGASIGYRMKKGLGTMKNLMNLLLLFLVIRNIYYYIDQ